MTRALILDCAHKGCGKTIVGDKRKEKPVGKGDVIPEVYVDVVD